MKSRILCLIGAIGALAGLAIPVRLAAQSTIPVSISPATATLQDGGAAGDPFPGTQVFTATVTNDPGVSTTQFTSRPIHLLYASEPWGAHVNRQNVGLTVYVPSQYPYVQEGDDFPDTNYFAPSTTLTFGPNFVFEGDFYVIAGDYPTARQIIYDLHQSLTVPDIFTPFGYHDSPAQGSVISGTTEVTGWAFDEISVAMVQVLVDGVIDGTASYGSPRPDVASVYANAPPNIGFSYPLDTTKYRNGAHTLNLRVTDIAGNVAIFPNRDVTISN